MMKMRPCAMRLLLLVLLTAALIPSALAENLSFQEDFEAIDHAAQSMFLVEVYDRYGDCTSTGSGFVAFDECLLVTNHHVVDEAHSMKVISDNYESSYDLGDVIIVDEALDLAIVEFPDGVRFDPLIVDGEYKILRGQPVTAIGSPKGVLNTVSDGIISALIPRSNGTYDIQFTAPISPGSSGGALFNSEGHVIGVVKSRHIEGDNMYYAVPAEYVVDLYEKADLSGAPSSSPYYAFWQSLPESRPLYTPAPTKKPSGVDYAGFMGKLIGGSTLFTPAPTPTPKPSGSDYESFMGKLIGGSTLFTPAPTPTPKPSGSDYESFMGKLIGGSMLFTPTPAPAPAKQGSLLYFPDDSICEYGVTDNGLGKYRFEMVNGYDVPITQYALYIYPISTAGERMLDPDVFYHLVVDKTIEPGERVFSDFVYISNYEKIATLGVAVKSIQLSDGTQEEYYILDDQCDTWTIR